MCGDSENRTVGSFFDHYWASSKIWPIGLGGSYDGDGVGLVMPYNGAYCTTPDQPAGWCYDNSIGRGDNRNYTEFQSVAQDIPEMPDGVVVAPLNSRLVWYGGTTRFGRETTLASGVCRSGGWQIGALLKIRDDEFAVMRGLVGLGLPSSLLVGKGQELGQASWPGSFNNPLVVRSAQVRAMHASWGKWFDPLGWGYDEANGYVAADQTFDPNYYGHGEPSPRRVDPLNADGQTCIGDCGSIKYVVDDDDAGFSCVGCSSPITSTFAAGGFYRTLPIAGDSVQTDAASWEASSAPAGVYNVYVSLAWWVDGDGDGDDDMETSSTARYRAGGNTIVASQKPDGPKTMGWYYLGTISYSTSPYLELSDAAYINQNRPDLDYIDFPECAVLYVDAVAFVEACDQQVLPFATVAAGTVVPAASVTPSW